MLVQGVCVLVFTPGILPVLLVSLFMYVLGKNSNTWQVKTYDMVEIISHVHSLSKKYDHVEILFQNHKEMT